MNWFSKIHELAGQEYERYLPTAFDESLTLLEKVNKVIETLNQIVLGVNTVADYVDGQVNTQNEKIRQLRDDFEILKDWLENEGLEERTAQVLNEWFDNGRLAQIINNDVFDMKADKVAFEQFVISTNQQLAQTEQDLTTQLQQTEEALTTQLTQATTRIGKKVNLSEYEHLVVDNDYTIALNTALSENDIVEVNQGVYHISDTINVGTKKLIGLGDTTTLRLTENIDGIEWENTGFVGNIRLDAHSIVGYSKRCFVFRGKSVVQHKTIYNNITAFMREIVADATVTGKGLVITTKNTDSAETSPSYIAYCIGDGFTCNGGFVGLEFELATNTTGGNWIQGNSFSNCIISAVKQMVIPEKASGNIFSGYIAQFKKGGQGDIRGTTSLFGWDPEASHFNIHDNTYLSGVIEPYTLRIPSDERRLAISSHLFNMSDGMVTESLGWTQDTYQELTTSTVKGFYEFLENCEGKELSNKWSLDNATQQPLGVVDVRKSHGMTIVQTDHTQPSKLWLDNCFITRDRSPRMLATVRHRYGGDVSSINGSLTQLGFISSEHNAGYWVEIDTNEPGTRQQAVIYAVTMTGEGGITKQLIKNKNGTNLLASYGDKITVEIVTKESGILFNVSLESYVQKASYAEGQFYTRPLRHGRVGTHEITTNLPEADTVIAPTMRYNAALGSATKQQKALLHMHVKSRYIGG